VKILAKQPTAGGSIDDMEPEYREWPINFAKSDYLALCRYDGKTAPILAVRHQNEVGY